MVSRVDDGLRSLFNKHLPHPRHMQNVELGMTNQGVPDLYYCINGISGWVECKATPSWGIGLRPSQIGWAVTHCRHGGRVLVAVRRRTAGGPRTPAADQLYLLRGHCARELRTGGLQWALSQPPGQVVLGMWSGGPTKWNWSAVYSFMRGVVL